MSIRVAIIGSGPSALYAAQALAVHGGDDVLVDVIDRLPTPFGLVRYGVAPDHLKIKSILETLHAVFDHPNVRFLGRLDVGTSLPVEQLRRSYHAVIYATGAQSDRHLQIPGEELAGSHSATEFVSWYSGHPLAIRSFDLSQVTSVAVIGAGNVALDVARLMAKHPDELRHTDVPDEVLQALSTSAVRDIYIVARRGPVHTKFSTKELRELGELRYSGVEVRPGDLPPESEDLSSATRAVRTNVALLREWATIPPGDEVRTVRLRFWRAPMRILGQDSVTGLELRDTSGSGSQTSETVPVQLVIRAIGYRSVPLPGVAFDEDAGVVPNDGGRILDTVGRPIPGEYVAGWLKRGPTGVIGTNKSDAEETVTALLADLAEPQPPIVEPIEAFLAENRLEYTEFEGWLRIDEAERQAGANRGGARVKIADWNELVRLAGVDGRPA